MPLPIVLAIAGAVFVVLLVVVLQRRAERRRLEAMQQAATALGMSFQAEGDLDQLRALGDLPLYGHGHSKKATNVLEGRAGDEQVRLFDYQYTTGGGKDSHTWHQTVAVYSGAAHGLPDFVLSPENILHKVGQLLGYQDIDFDSSPAFSNRYLLRGPDEDAIRAAFSIETRSFFEQQPGWTAEVRDGTVAVYRSGKPVKPEDLAAYVEETRAVLRALRQR